MKPKTATVQFTKLLAELACIGLTRAQYGSLIRQTGLQGSEIDSLLELAVQTHDARRARVIR